MFGFLVAAALAADPSAPHEHQGKLPAFKGAPPAVVLSADELARLAGGQPVLKQVEGAGGGRGVAVMDVRATPATVWSRITNYAMYPKWVDNVAECGNYRTEGNTLYTRFVLDPLGMKVEYYIKHVYNPSAGWLTWTLDYARKSDLDDSVGYWRVTALTADPPRTRVEYSVGIQIKGWIPGFVADMIAKQGLENAVLWVKRESER
jgi:hypothetical protein